MKNIYPVGQVTHYLKESIEADDFLADLWVTGELSNVTRSSAGHLYFTLKDMLGQIRSVMFRSALNGDVAASDGDSVIAHGRISFYEVRGDLQFIADVLMPQGTGALYLEFQRLKAKLEAEGLFDPSRKRALPAFPRRIAVVTSPAGAVRHDIVNVIGRRYPLVELFLVPVAVQGESAAKSIAGAFKMLNSRHDIDLIILARGGGSIEELWPFNEESTARAIYSSRTPVISAVGHETDFTIADYVADLRAPTPSAAAELAVPSRIELAARLAAMQGILRGVLSAQLEGCVLDVGQMKLRLRHGIPDIARERQRLDDATRNAHLHMRSSLTALRASVDQRIAALYALNPQRTLGRGYAVVQKRGSGAVIRRRGDVASGDALTVQVSDGRFDATADGDAPRKGRRPKVRSGEQMALFGG